MKQSRVPSHDFRVEVRVTRVADGVVVLDECRLIEAAGTGTHVGGASLTNREREVVALAGRGRTNPEIARELAVAESTVKFHLRGAMSKTGARNRTELAAWAWSAGAVATNVGTPTLRTS